MSLGAIDATCLIDCGQTANVKTAARNTRASGVPSSPANTTADLTRRVARGDRNALAVFYERWFDTMYHEAARTTGRDEAFCLDVVQDVMLRVIKKLSAMESDAQLAAWLRKVVRSCAYDRLRSDIARAKRENTRIRSLNNDLHRCAASITNEDEERLEWLHNELESMDEKLRRPLLLRVLSGWTLAQIGTLLGLSPGAVDGRVNRAMKQLRRNAERSDE